MKYQKLSSLTSMLILLLVIIFLPNCANTDKPKENTEAIPENETKEITTFKGLTEPIYSLAFSPDSKILAVGVRDGVTLVEIPTGKELNRIAEKDSFPKVAFSPDGKILAIGGNFGELPLIDPNSAGKDLPNARVRLFDISAGKEINTIKTDANSADVAFSSNGKILAIGDKDFIKLVDPATGQELSRINDKFYFEVAFLPDSKSLAISDFHTIKLWDVTANKEAAAFTQDHAIGNCTLSPDGKILAFSYGNDTMKLIEATTGKEIKVFSADDTNESLAFSADSKILAVSGLAVRLYDAATGNQIAQIIKKRINQDMLVAFSPRGRLLAIGDKHSGLKLWTVAATK